MRPATKQEIKDYLPLIGKGTGWIKIDGKIINYDKGKITWIDT